MSQPLYLRFLRVCRDSQAMHAEVVAQDEDVTAAQDKMTGLHTEVRGVARQAYGYRRR
jgi:hypothetical protein